MMELVARIRALLRRTSKGTAIHEYRMGCLYVCPERHQVRVDGQDVVLTYKEFELLCLMLENQGMVMTRNILMYKIWGVDQDRENRTLDVHIRTLRSKLGPPAPTSRRCAASATGCVTAYDGEDLPQLLSGGYPCGAALGGPLFQRPLPLL